MHIEFSGTTVIVTGAAHGFGRAICLAFAERGATVWGCDLLPDELAETQALCAAAAARAKCTSSIFRDRDAVRRFVEFASVESGQVDILVNNAGGVLGFVGKPVEDVTPEEWNNILAVNLSGAFWFAQRSFRA